MPITTFKDMLLKAQKDGYAVAAFNVENMEMAQAVVAAAEELRSPVIVQTTPSTISYADPDIFFSMICAVARNADVPVTVHLDHGSSFELCAKALRAGYTGIMIDGSKLPLNENITTTKKVVEMCHAAGVSVEAELGQVGGKEDDLECENAGYTIPAEAVRFEKEATPDILAVGVGTAHGFYAEAPVLNLELISELKSLLSIPMVLHGASGLSDDTVKECIKRGICKVNFATELRVAYSDGIKKLLGEKPETFDPKTYGKVARENVKKLVCEKILLCGSNNKY